MTKQTNRLYMLTVRHESLMNKRRSLEIRLKEITDQLKGIEADIRTTEAQYRKLKGNRSRKNGSGEEIPENRGNGRELKRMLLQF